MSNASAINLHDFSEEELTELSMLIYAERESRKNEVISEGLEMVKKGLEKICSIDQWFDVIPDIGITDADGDCYYTSISASQLYDNIKKTS